MAPVTSARGLAGTDSWEGGEAAENQTELLKHEWHHSRGASARRADCMHNPGVSRSSLYPARHSVSRICSAVPALVFGPRTIRTTASRSNDTATRVLSA